MFVIMFLEVLPWRGDVVSIPGGTYTEALCWETLLGSSRLIISLF